LLRNIIFDIGNVLLLFKPEEFLLRFTDDHEMINFFINNITRSQLWLELDRGNISVKSARNDFLQKFPERKTIIDLFFENWMEIFVPIQENVKIIQDLKKKEYDCYYLSNFIREAYEFVIKKFEFFNFFNGGIISAYVKAIKPEIEIFTYLLEKYELNPEECVFIDDVYGFLRPARKLGFKTIQYVPNFDLRQELNNLGIDI
jgi:putative hydrolase of the HAD superfamily